MNNRNTRKNNKRDAAVKKSSKNNLNEYEYLLDKAWMYKEKMNIITEKYYPDRDFIKKMINQDIKNETKKGASPSEKNNAVLRIVGNYAKSSGLFTKKANRAANGIKAMVEALYKEREPLWKETYEQKYLDLEKDYKNILKRIKDIETSTPDVKNLYQANLRATHPNPSLYNDRKRIARDLNQV